MAEPSPKTVIYKRVGDVEIPLDVFLPPNAEKVPVLLWFHGGGLLQDKRVNWSPHHVRGVNKYKYAFVTADYRLAPQVTIDDIFEDVKDCISFIREKLSQHLEDGSIDPSRLAVSGSSAGGYLSFLAGLYVDPKPKVILPIYPITDPLGTFFTNSKTHSAFGSGVERETVAPYLDPKGEIMVNSERGTARNKMYGWMMQEANLAQLLHLKPGDSTYRIAHQIYEHRLPPTYVVHGDQDSFVGVEQADEVIGVMAGLEMVFEYERMHGVDHLFDRDESVELERMYAFFLKHI